jgi:hypothetical protein
MAEAAGRTPQDDDSGRAHWAATDEIERWPVSAVCAVAVLSVVVLLLLLMNVLGLHLMGDDGGYDPATGGSVAEWFGAIATLVALPAAVLFGIKQLQSSTDALQLGQRQLAADQAEREERRSIELAVLRSALRLTVEATNVVDDTALATEDERTAVAAWRHEFHQRGWTSDEPGAGWQRGTQHRTNAGQLSAEPSPLLAQPWLVAVGCRNVGGSPLTVLRWTVVVDGRSATVDDLVDLGPGDAVRRRLGNAAGGAGAVIDAGLPSAHAQRSDAEAVARRVTVLVDATDSVGRSVRIVQPPPD